MAKPILDDALWAQIEPLMPPPKPHQEKHLGRKPLENRATLTGILFVLKTGIPWAMLPQEMGCDSGMSCWHRLRAWQEAVVWDRPTTRRRLHRLVPCHRRFFVHSRSGGGPKTGPNPTDRARPGSKHHLVTETQGIPLALILTGADRNDVTQLLPLIEAIPPIRGKRGRPLSKPRIVQADHGYDHDKYRRPLHAAGIVTEIARRGEPHSSGLGKTRWVVERTHACLHTTSDACAFALSDWPSFMKPFSRSPAASFAGAN